MSAYERPPVHTMRPDVKMRSTIGDRGGRSTSPGKIERWYVLCSLKRSYSRFRSIVVPGGSETCATRFWIWHDDTSNRSRGLARRRMRVISCDATMHALNDVEPVITSFPDPNSRQVQCGFARRIVIAAKRLRSYVVNGKRSASRCRLMLGCVVKICDVDTMLWHCGTGIIIASSPSVLLLVWLLLWWLVVSSPPSSSAYDEAASPRRSSSSAWFDAAASSSATYLRFRIFFVLL